ncbi:hypothetical protein ACIGW0_24365 [Streptomyces bikiniensis]|uniref:DUF3592 domain-containing protein n=1 Tax=Streptomyces bikiniensis TaxID=1896 RepID=A0ABW8CZD9_STRBI
MPHTPDPGTPESAHEEEPWLSSDEVAKLWPIRKNWLPGVACRADVRVRRVGGESRGTWGTEPTFHYFHPGDVRRAAPAIAEGTVDVPSDWRTDTPDGRRAEFWGVLSTRIAVTLLIALTLCSLFLVLGSAVFLLTVE